MGIGLESTGRDVVRRLRAGGHEAYWVGGCVRDRLLGLPAREIDVATSARPGEVSSLFPETRLVGASFGVCLVRQGGFQFEIATFRRDGRYLDSRHPDTVEFGTVEQDARRRDFTINALFYDPELDRVLDFVGGRADLERRLLRTVGDPGERLREDALRLLRAVRFAARFGLTIEEATWRSITENAPLIRKISPERQRDELTVMLMESNPSRPLRLLDESGLLALLLPEISAMKGVEQGKRSHPEGDVFEHTLLCLDHLQWRTPVTVWAALLHDVAKPRTFERREGKITFYGHEALGEEMARGICERFRFPREMIDKVAAVVGRHMRFINALDWNDSTMRRFLSADTIREDLELHRADCLSSHGDLRAWRHVSDRHEELRERQENPIPPPLLTGRDLIEMGYEPGPRFRHILDAVQEEQLEGRLESTEAARGFVRERFPRGQGAGPSEGDRNRG